MCNSSKIVTTQEEAYRRAGGRRHYNRCRAMMAMCRRLKVCRLFWGSDLPKLWGQGARIARILGVSRATVCRDLKVVVGHGLHHRMARRRCGPRTGP